MIHFQHDQDGATLRATELKPKLDKYLKETEPDVFKKYKGDHDELPYRISVRGMGAHDTVTIEKKWFDRRAQKEKKNSFPCFFGNMGDDKQSGNEKKFVTNNQVKLVFSSFNSEIIRTIEKQLPYFLFQTNFGTRQSKGFGSFYIDSDDPLYFLPLLKKCYSFKVKSSERDFYKKYKQLFEKINLLYQTLRSGINQVDRNKNTVFYFKSLMFQYAKSKGWAWDKKLLKSAFLKPYQIKDQRKKHPKSDLISYSSKQGYLVRDLLGFATTQMYRSDKFSVQHDKENEIKRFKSPIIFKPIEKTPDHFVVYLFTTPLPLEIFDQSVKIHKMLGKKSDQNITLKTPPKTSPPSFDIDDYLHFAIHKAKLSDCVDPKYRNHFKYRALEKIYNDLKRS